LRKKEFQGCLLEWYYEHKRDLPWRKTNDPYRIWLSEIILQQTRVSQGLPYYEKFIKNYPTVKQLADAEEDKVMKHWEGLGYYSRARNMQAAAQHIQYVLNGEFPNTYTEIIKLKGVGDYTASAISSFSFGETRAVLDGNVFRVLSRFFGIETAINSTQGKKEFGHLAKDMLDASKPADYNQAIMEFGAIQCTPKSPNCEVCPLASACVAKMESRVEELPKKEKGNSKKDRYFNYLLVNNDGKVAIERREIKDIWLKLFQFPLIESVSLLETPSMIDSFFTAKEKDFKIVVERYHDLKPHILSHQRIHIRLFEVKVSGDMALLKPDYEWRLLSDLKDLAFPKPLRAFLDRNQLTLPFV
jgi:A/G-specific adenine glycosylase